jgi:hypothetical protein
MGCNSEHMNARPGEVLSRETAEHIVYLNGKLAIETPIWVATAAKEYYGAESRVDEVVALLCTTIRSMTPEQVNAIVYNGHDATARKLANWWDEHQAADRKRALADVEAEQELARAEALLTAITKLTALKGRTGPDANTITLEPAEQAALIGLAKLKVAA